VQHDTGSLVFVEDFVAVIDDAKTYDLAPSEWRPTSLVSSPGTILSEVEPERETRSGPTQPL
jgi:hypothetical protein